MFLFPSEAWKKLKLGINIYTKLPIFKQALNLNTYIEKAVVHFQRMHKYSIGKELRVKAREIIYGIYRSYLNKNKISHLEKLKNDCEELKIIIYIANDIQALRTPKQFETLSLMALQLSKDYHYKY